MNCNEDSDIVNTKTIGRCVIVALLLLTVVIVHGCYQVELTNRASYEADNEKFDRGYIQKMVPSHYEPIWVRKEDAEADAVLPTYQKPR